MSENNQVGSPMPTEGYQAAYGAPTPSPQPQPAAEPQPQPAAEPQPQPAAEPQPQAAPQPQPQAERQPQPAAAPVGYGAMPADGSVPPASPVPPAPAAPVAASYPGAPAPYGYEVPASSQKRRWPWFLLGLAVGLLIGLGGCASCVAVMAATSHQESRDYAQPVAPEIDLGSPQEDDRGYHDRYGYGDNGNNGDERDSDSRSDSPIVPGVAGTYSYDEIASVMFPDGVSNSAPAEGTVCKEGMYTVGAQGQIPAGLYLLQGSEDVEGRFFVFDGADAKGSYEIDDAIVYFGNYFTELEEGDLIVFKPGADVTMAPAPATSIGAEAPYNDGCYRVGIDIPAGTYTITSYEPSAAVATADSAAFVMKDLDFDDDSIVKSAYVIPGGQQTVTVENGQYLELFAATATPADPAAQG